MKLEDKLREHNIAPKTVEGQPIAILENGVVYQHPSRPVLGYIETSRPHTLLENYKGYRQAVKDWRKKGLYGGIALIALPLAAGVYFGIDVDPSTLRVDTDTLLAGMVGAVVLPIAYMSYFWKSAYQKFGITSGMATKFDQGVKPKKEIFKIIEQQSSQR